MDDDMFYVAADPEQPGAAWACCVDDPQHPSNTADSIAEWARDGAHIMRVNRETMIEMMGKWQPRRS